jgi:SAM-dependent methyltransferase
MMPRRAVLAILLGSRLRGQRKETQMFGDAQAYDRFMGRWSRLVAPLLVDFAGVPESGRVLDIGSGTGSLAFAIAGKNSQAQVTGIDPSHEYVEYANRTNPLRERVRFQPGDAQQLDFPDAAFHASLSLLVFNFIPDAGKALREARRVTRPGGGITAATWDYSDGMRMLRVFWDAVVSLDPGAEKLDEKNMPLCRAGELAKLWTQSGLRNVDEQPLEVTMRFESFADYWDPFLLGQGPAGNYVRKIDTDRREALRADLRRRLPLANDDAPFELPARVWAVRGTVPAKP